MKKKPESGLNFTQKNYKAKYVDGKKVPKNGILFVGMSMITQPKLQGSKLLAEAELFQQSLAKHKFVYLGDALQMFNAAADYLISLTKKHKKPHTLLSSEFPEPECMITDKVKAGTAWIGDHGEKFSSEKSINKTIFRHADIRKSTNFSKYLDKTIQWYLDEGSEEFCKQVNMTVQNYMRRNKFGLKNTMCSYDGNRLFENDPLSNAVKKYLKQKKEVLTNRSQNLSYLDNAIYHEFLKLSFSYVFEELAGFRTAVQTIKTKHLKQKSKDDPFFFIYPGQLTVINAYFDLVPDVTMITKEVVHQQKAIDKTEDNFDTESSASSESNPASPHENEKDLDCAKIWLEQRRKENSNYSFQQFVKETSSSPTSKPKFTGKNKNIIKRTRSLELFSHTRPKNISKANGSQEPRYSF